MIKIAITGNIAAGKSVIERILSDLHYPVVDTDKIVHYLFKNSQDLNIQLRESFAGYDIYTDDLIDRRKLAKVVFADKKLLKRLEANTHPYIIDEVLKFFERNSNANFCFVSVPLLYEVNWTYLFDKVIMVAANDDIRMQRLMMRRNLTKKEALKRMNAQIPQEEKIKFADFVIYNNTNYIDLNRQINDVLCRLI
ncbi:MAG: dephospho-CoA kinase [Candidatus Gastranaerophilales bacterium]|nr:dephospho-CoA kinase [Candidatus Gastranaerophilales bacterium]